MKDVRTARRTRWGELAHIIGARPDAARGDSVESSRLERDPSNILLLCPSCHTKVDRDPVAYPVEQLRGAKAAQEERVRAAAAQVGTAQVLPVVLTSVIQGGPNVVNDELIAQALLPLGLVRGRETTFRIDMPDPAEYGGRVEAYWQQSQHLLRNSLVRALRSHGSDQGQLGALACFGRADMPSLMALGSLLGNRVALQVLQPRRSDGRWDWPDLQAASPEFSWTDPASLPSKGPVALVLSLSVRIRLDDVLCAFEGDPSVRVVVFTVPQPDHELARGPAIGPAFHEAIRRCVSEVEAVLGDDRTIHVFPALPASLAVHFGAAITLNYMPRFEIYDRSGQGMFARAMTLPLLEPA